MGFGKMARKITMITPCEMGATLFRVCSTIVHAHNGRDIESWVGVGNGAVQR